MDYLVNCVNKVPSDDAHAGITHLGGPAGGGWRRERAIIIHLIEAGTDTFYTNVGGNEVQVVVIESAGGKYLRGRSAGCDMDDLLTLRECTRPIKLDSF